MLVANILNSTKELKSVLNISIRHIVREIIDQVPVVQRLDNAIHWINHYPVGSMVCFVNIYPLDSDLSGG